jgi:hypothetical protein
MPNRTNWLGRPMKMEYRVQHYLLEEEVEEEEEKEEVEEETETEEEVEEVKEVEKVEKDESRRLNIALTAT